MPDPSKKRLIVDFKNITNSILTLFTERYPYGYDDDDIIRFTKPSGEKVSAVPFETDETYYLIKIGVEMDKKINAFLEGDAEDDSAAMSSLPEVDVEYDGSAEIDEDLD